MPTSNSTSTPTDYVLFVHGVKSRSEDDFQKNAQSIFGPIAAKIKSSERNLVSVPCFWGKCGEPALNQLQDGLRQSKVWNDLWFRDFREQEILSFVGDAALYLSRSIGAEVVDCIYKNALALLKNVNPGDRLHLVTHSWGTVILFDILFAKRWASEAFKAVDSETWENVQQIRDALFGLGKNPGFGLKLGSIHTMGSPIALFNLMNTGESNNSHDITSDLPSFLQTLKSGTEEKSGTGRALPWNNYLHPADPIAYPLEGIMPEFLKNELTGETAEQSVKVRDILVKTNAWSEKLMAVTRSTFISILYGGTAHNSYWKLPEIPSGIIDTIES
jgi:hypothetical protein